MMSASAGGDGSDSCVLANDYFVCHVFNNEEIIICIVLHTLP